MKKKELEIKLQSLTPFRNPKVHLEQYATPANVAADILYLAYMLGDLRNKQVADFGAGFGIFTVGSCILNALRVYAVEVDPDAVDVLQENVSRWKCSSVDIINTNVENLSMRVDTVFQNVPFGSQNRHADRIFIKTAMESGSVVYALHNSVTADYVIDKYLELGGVITHRAFFEFTIPKIFHFHRRDRVSREFIFLRVESRG